MSGKNAEDESSPGERGPRVAFITGASAGFGREIVRRLHRRGAHVVALARRADRLEELVQELGRSRVLALNTDVRDREALERAVRGLPEEFANVDLLVNNAGLALGLDPAQRADPDDWERMIDTNCKGLVHATRLLLPGMVARARGHVINLGSTAGSYPYTGGNVYGATKAFVHQFSLNLRSDLHGTGIRVTCVEPGLVGGTEFSEVRFHGDRARAAEVYAGANPLTPEDVAGVVEWAAYLPERVNVNTIELMPTDQSFAGLQLRRSKS
jgi:3-hydroxy acid dehydrogenase / malonic semialdehyde reductase